MIHVESHYNGPPESGHGGISAGLLASHVEDPTRGVVVRLQSPVPLATDLSLVLGHDDSVTAYAGEAAIAVARPLTEALEVGAFPELTSDEVDSAREQWLRERARFNPFPSCYGCGTERADGWRLAPGLVPGAHVHAAAWTARFDGRVPVWAPWAVLDCTQVGPVIEVTEPPAGLLTGQIAVRSVRAVEEGRAYVALSRRLERSGKKVFTEGALLDDDGLVAVASATWFVVPSY